MSMSQQGPDGRWLPAEPMPEPFGVLWGRLWHERQRHGEPKWVALFTSLRDARAVAKLAQPAAGKETGGVSTILGRIACKLGWHRFAAYHWGELGDGPCLRCGKEDRP